MSTAFFPSLLLATLIFAASAMSWTLKFVGVLVVVLLVKRVARYIEIKRFKQKHGCEPPPYYEQSERIVGWGLYKTQMKASKEHRLLQAGRERYLRYGNTLSLNLMGMEFVNVSSLLLDPKILVHQESDTSPPDNRRRKHQDSPRYQLQRFWSR